jgi:hypothetical protein
VIEHDMAKERRSKLTTVRDVTQTIAPTPAGNLEMSNESDGTSAKTTPDHDPLRADLMTYIEWTGYPKWSAKEAACLLLGLNPDILDPPNKAFGLFYDAALERDHYPRLRQLTKRALQHQQLKEPTPASWVEWARTRLLDVVIPTALIEALEKRSAQAHQSSQTKKPRPSKLKTAARYANWQAKADELLRQKKEKKITAIAKEICQDPVLNPPDEHVDAGTIRRHLRLPDWAKRS